MLQCWSVGYEERKRSYPRWALGLLLCVFVQDHCKVDGLPPMDFQKHQCTSKSFGASVNSCNFGGVCQPTTGGGEVQWFTTESLLFWEKDDGSLFLFSQKGRSNYQLDAKPWSFQKEMGSPSEWSSSSIYLSRSKFLIKFTTTYSESRGI